MSNDLRWPGIPESVHKRIARGEVPPPRDHTDPPDPIRDLRLSLAVAEANDNHKMVDHLNARWLTLQVQGQTSSWQIEPDKQAGPVYRDDLLRQAEKAEEDGRNAEGANLRLRALHASLPMSDETATALEEAEAAEDWDEHGRLAVRAMYEVAGEEVPAPIQVKPDYAASLSNAELHSARERAEAAGDWRESDRLNALLAHRSSRRKDRVAAGIDDNRKGA